ncbi:hypothetical protein MVEN_01409100 [Mycena venus]|uniref:DUF6534 domain-containing protein n=1 Tax=Mycena venus TaxID=2733690 RepID=A0A8H6XYV9_9AGAR|nr:hypothetical protein MVEN_01409100 [Mycena venus]
MSTQVFFTGPILIGTQLNWALLGVLMLQVLNFASTYRKERVGIKALVYWLLFLDLTQTALASHFAFCILVSGWGNPLVFIQLPWSSCTVPVLAGFISASVQIFFAWRIYALEGRRNHYILGICGLIVLLALMQSLCAIVNGIREGIDSQLANFPSFAVGVKIWLIGSAVCDVVIAATMITILARYRKMTPWKKTDNIITKLIYHTVQTGAITAIVAIVDMVLFLIYPQYLFHVAPSFVLGKMYSNVVLATLNARTTTPWGGTTSDTLPISGGESHQLQWHTPTTRTEDTTHIVHVSTVTEISSDIDAKNTNL